MGSSYLVAGNSGAELMVIILVAGVHWPLYTIASYVAVPVFAGLCLKKRVDAAVNNIHTDFQI